MKVLTGQEMNEHNQQPRHLLRVEDDGEDQALSLVCPFGNSFYASSYPTLHDLMLYRAKGSDYAEIVDQPQWPCEIGQLQEGYCSMSPHLRYVFRFPSRGAVIELQPIASSKCIVEYEAEQIGLEDLLDDIRATYLQPGYYEVRFGSEGWGEDYSTWLELVSGVRVAPLD